VNIRFSTCEDFTEVALRLRDRIDLGPKQLYRLVGVGLSNFLLDQAEAEDGVRATETDELEGIHSPLPIFDQSL
jgi:DNA polymerase IV